MIPPSSKPFLRKRYNHSQIFPSGVFDTANDVSLNLLIDIKTDGVEYVPVVPQYIVRV